MVTKKTILPKLRKIDSSLKKHKYKLKFINFLQNHQKCNS